jgi:hypothetical protein
MKSVLDLRKQIKVIDHELSEKGLIINYSLAGKEIQKAFTPIETLELLKTAGYIDRHEGESIWIIMIFVSEQDLISIYTWDEFVKTFMISQYDAIDLMAWYEFTKAFKNYAIGANSKKP